MDTLFEIFKGLGGLAGLVSAAYLAWQFLTRRLPVAIIVARKAHDLFPRKDQHLRIKNPADRAMVIRFEENTGLNELRAALDDSTRSAVRRAIGRSEQVILDGGETRDFRIERRKDLHIIDPDNQLVVRFHWRYAQPFILQGERVCTVQIAKRDFEALVDDHDNGEQDD